MEGILKALLQILIILIIGGVASAFFYYYKRRELFAGFVGGLTIAVIGGMIGNYVLDKVVKIVWDIFSNLANVNVFATLIGAYAAVFILNQLTHEKVRKKY